MFENF